MKSIDSMRKYVLTAPSICSTTRAILVCYIDNIEREVADMVPLPVDADGVPIHVGDVLDGYGKTIEVVELRYGRSGWVLISRDGNGYADCAAFSHHHAPTVEDVLADVADRAANLTGSYHEGGMNGDEYMDSMSALVTEYAAKLRLASNEE